MAGEGGSGGGAPLRETLDEAGPGMLSTFRQSIRRVGEKSPFSPSKRSKVTGKSDAGTPDAAAVRAAAPPRPAPPSPSLSSGSPMTSPLKAIGGLFQKKEELAVPGCPPGGAKTLSHSRTYSDPIIALSSSFSRTGASIRRRFSGKKDKEKEEKEKEKVPKQEVLPAVSEATAEERKEVEEETEIPECYTLPEIPHTPLSVMQINKLIEMEVLEEAHLNLLSLRREFQWEQSQCGEEASSMDLAKKEKDLSLLYGELRDKVKTIVRDSNSLPSRNKGLLVHVARIIQEEERRQAEPGGLSGPGGWMEGWREAVSEGVQAKLGGVRLDAQVQNPSWLAIHLGLLGHTVVEDLENVKRELRWSYPPSFRVFSTYVGCYHQAVGQHLKKLQFQATELKDLYALLDWIINRYQSENVMGCPSLRVEMESEVCGPALEDGFLDQLKHKYCSRAQEETRLSLDKIVEMQNEEVWKERNKPQLDEKFLSSDIVMDIWTRIQGVVGNSRKVDAQLGRKVVCACLEELKHFPKRFEASFRAHCGPAETPPSLLAEYHISYINSFTELKSHMEAYVVSCPQEVEQFNEEVNGLVRRLGRDLEDQYKDDVKPYLRRMMTRKWLRSDEDFRQLHRRTDMLLQQSEKMRPPHVQTLVERLQRHVVKELAAQLMKNSYSCRNVKHEKAARKMRRQWAELAELFVSMGSTQEWLLHLGEHLSDIIGRKNKTDIKDHLQPLAEQYPDFSKKHLSAVLYFRGLVRGRERQLILQRLVQIQRGLGDRGDRGRALFSEVPVPVHTDCLAELPLCLSFLLPDN